MKKVLIMLLIAINGGNVFAYYDFCQSPQDYNTFPPLYDVRTEYWKDIPQYCKNKIQYKNTPNMHDLTQPTQIYTDKDYEKIPKMSR